MITLQWHLNSRLKKNAKPIKLPMPWDRQAKPEQVTPEEREALRAELLERSAMRNL